MEGFEQVVGSLPGDGGVKLLRLLEYTVGEAREAIRRCPLIEGQKGYSLHMLLDAIPHVKGLALPRYLCDMCARALSNAYHHVKLCRKYAKTFQDKAVTECKQNISIHVTERTNPEYIQTVSVVLKRRAEDVHSSTEPEKKQCKILQTKYQVRYKTN